MKLFKSRQEEKSDSAGPNRNKGKKPTSASAEGYDRLARQVRLLRSESIELRAALAVLKRDLARLDKYFYQHKAEILMGNVPDQESLKAVKSPAFVLGEETY